jgi:hypothetical protein
VLVMLLGVQLRNVLVSTPLTWPATGLSEVSARMGRLTFSNQLFSTGTCASMRAATP